MLRSERVAKATLVSVVGLLLTSCVGETRPFAYDTIERSQSYISKEVLARLVLEHQTREQVIVWVRRTRGMLNQPPLDTSAVSSQRARPFCCSFTPSGFADRRSSIVRSLESGSMAKVAPKHGCHEQD
jgi:hypothetical protein